MVKKKIFDTVCVAAREMRTRHVRFPQTRKSLDNPNPGGVHSGLLIHVVQDRQWVTSRSATLFYVLRNSRSNIP